MFINIIAQAGEGKTKTALDFGSIDLMKYNKVVFLTTDNDFTGWRSYVEDKVGKENLEYFRPMYAKNLESALQILPYIDHLPYSTIILDGFSTEIIALENKEEVLKQIESYTINKNGKVIMTLKAEEF